jgi:hypothetical protein
MDVADSIEDGGYMFFFSFEEYNIPAFHDVFLSQASILKCQKKDKLRLCFSGICITAKC